MTPMLVAFDPSLRASALVALTLDGVLTPLLASALPTKPSVKRDDYFLNRQIDDLKRARRVNRWAALSLRGLDRFEGYYVAAIAMESPSGIPTSFKRPKSGEPPKPKGWRPPQDATAFGKLVRSGQAIYDAAAEVFPDMSPVLVSTYAAKEAATGSAKPKGKKREVQLAVERLFGALALQELLVGVEGGADGVEGVCDALAVALGSLGSVPVRAAMEEFRRAEVARKAREGL